MPDFKKDWPDKVFKLIMAILSIVFGYTQYSEHQEHLALKDDLTNIEAFLSGDSVDMFAEEHTDLLQME